MKDTFVVRYLWITIGWLFFGIGITGLFLPILPCTPFMILATFCFSRGSQRLHLWILSLPRIGPMVRDWEEKGAIRPRAKVLSSITILGGAAYPLLIMPMPIWGRALFGVCICGVLLFIWSRPST